MNIEYYHFLTKTTTTTTTTTTTSHRFDPSRITDNNFFAEEEDDEDEGEGRRGVRSMSWEERLQRPCLGDDGMLAPELLRLWARTLTPDASVGYTLRRSIRRAMALARIEESDDDDDEEEADEVEAAR